MDMPVTAASLMPPTRTRFYCAVRLVVLALCLGIALVTFAGWALSPWFDFSLNLTESLPGTLYVTHKHIPVARGDLVAFRWRGGATYPRGVIFIKRVMGVAGDTVSVRDGMYYVNDTRIGRAKPYSRAGVPLEPAAPGRIASGTLFVATPHPDSLDSRYAIEGNVPEADVIGRAYAIF